MTPNNLVNMAVINRLDVIALTDHNSCRNCAAAMTVGESAGILVIPGMELTTLEEIHVVCLFSTVECAQGFDSYVYARLPGIENVVDIFGEQLILDENDKKIGNIDKLLINATEISVMEVVELVNRFGGICYPAHIDKSSNSILQSLGVIPEECGFSAAEITSRGDVPALLQANPILGTMPLIKSSDAHYLEHIAEPCAWIEADGKNPDDIIKAIKKGCKWGR